EWKMLHVGRGRALLVLGVVWAFCMTSAGCIMNVSFSNAPAPPPKDGKADKQNTTAKSCAPESVVPVSFEQAPKTAELPGDSPGRDKRPTPRNGDKSDTTGGATGPAVVVGPPHG